MDEEQVAELINAVRSIAHGGLSGPSGLEMLAMALAGEGLRKPIGEQINNAGSEIADAINNLADAIRGLGVK